MTFLVVLFFVLSLLSGLFTGQISGAALLRGAEEGARLALSLAGPLCLWSEIGRASCRERVSLDV